MALLDANRLEAGGVGPAPAKINPAKSMAVASPSPMDAGRLSPQVQVPKNPQIPTTTSRQFSNYVAPQSPSTTAMTPTPNVKLTQPAPSKPGPLALDAPPSINLSTPTSSTATMSPTSKGSMVTDIAAELTGLPAAARLATGTSRPLAGSKALGVGVDVLSVLPGVGLLGKAAKGAGLLGKTARAEGVANAAYKGAQFAKTEGAAKAGALGAAAMIATAPAGHIDELTRLTPAITQSAESAVNAGKSVVSKADTFTPKITKGKASAVDNIQAPKAGPKSTTLDPSKVQKATNATKAAGATASAINAARQATTATAPAVSNNPSSSTPGKPGAGAVTATDASTSTIKYKGMDPDEFKNPVQENVVAPSRAKEVAPYSAAASVISATEGTSGTPREPVKGGGVKPPVVPLPIQFNSEEIKRKRKWAPSAVV